MDISIIEFIVYGLVAYSSLLMLIISTIRDPPCTKAHSIVRSMYLIPGIICMIIIAGSGTIIYMETMTTNITTTSNVTAELWTEVGTHERSFELLNPVWVTVHFLFAIIMIVYVILQMVTLFTKVE